jgi:outer membrane protein insertion porin family
MVKFYTKFLSLIILLSLAICNTSFSTVVKEFEINGNQRIPDSTILMFSSVSVLDDINTDSINEILKSLYETNYFKNVSVSLDSNKLIISVEENPIIENIDFDGIKSNTLKSNILKDVKLKSRSSYNKFLLDKDKNLIISALKNYGYYQPSIDVFVENLSDNKVNIKFDIDIGDKAKIKKITFLGNKIFKDSKLKNVIVSEEYKFWKFISGKKYLNENIVNLDIRLLNNFYRNKGFYNVEINSSFAKSLSSNEFELIYNINANQVIYFGNLILDLPSDYDKDNFSTLIDTFNETMGKKYSINLVEKILDKIDEISINEQYQSIKASVEESIEDNKINLTFKIEETDKFYVNKINIFGNNVTEENVIRNQFEIDEGDPYNDILLNKSINNLKQLNFFRSVNHEVLDENDADKIVNIYLEEKPTGEIAAGAGFGTSGGTIFFNIKENNYLGKGILVDSQLQLSAESIKGSIKTTNNNYKNTNKSVSFGLEADEVDRLSDFGYKSNKTGFSLGTKFEYLDDLRLGLGTSTYYERIETDNTASARQKKQEGDYWDTFLDIDFSYDKRNQRFKATQGFTSYYSLNLPIISTNYSVTSGYNYKVYTELFENNISSFSFSLKGASSLTGKDIKLSERLYVPSSKLRGFEQGKVGPKDGSDFIGGNYVTTMNLTSTLPQILSNLQTVDFLLFLDAANIWGVDYDSSIDNSSEIRSAIGIGVDWFTPVGPLNFSFAQDLTSHKDDITETFRFNLGTTF